MDGTADIDVDPLDAVKTATLTVTMLAAGALLGIGYVTLVVASHQPPLASADWVDAVQTARHVAIAVVVVGFAVLLLVDAYRS